MALAAKGMTVTDGSLRTSKDPRRIKIYDFRRPDKFSRDQIRTFWIMHQTFARLASASLTAATRRVAEVKLASVDQLTFGEFLESLPEAPVLLNIDMTPLPGATLLVLDSVLAYHLADLTMGAPPELATASVEHTADELTPTDASVLRGLAERMLAVTTETWSGLVSLVPRLVSIERLPQFAQIVPPNDMIVLASAPVTVDDRELGYLDFAVPYLTIERVASRLTARYWYGAAFAARGSRSLGARAADVELEAAVWLQGERPTLSRVATLRPGQRVTLAERDKKVKAFTGSSGAALLSLRAAGAEPQWRTFEVEWPAASTSLDRALIGDGASPDEADPVQLALREIADKIEGRLDSVSEMLAALASRQDELVDQVAFADEGPLPASGAAVAAGRDTPFRWAAQVDADTMLAAMSQERDQPLAMVLSHLPPTLVAEVLQRLSAARRASVVQRMAEQERVGLDMLERTADAVKRAVTQASVDARAASSAGYDVVVDVLALTSRSVERGIVAELERRAPQVAEEIKKRLFVFEDIGQFDDASIATLVDAAAPDLLAFALKTVEPQLRERVLAVADRAAAARLRADFEALGNVRLREVGTAQQGVVAVIRRLEEEGAMTVARDDEMA